MTIDVLLSGRDAASLDRATGAVITGMPASEYGDAVVNILPRENASQRRRIRIEAPSNRLAGHLARITIPDTVAVRIRHGEG